MAKMRPIVIGLLRSTNRNADENGALKSTISGSDIATRWQAAASPGGLIGVLGIVLAMMLTGGTVVLITGHTSLPVPTPIAWLALLGFIALIGALGYLVYGYVTIAYEFSSEHLTIRWAGQEHVIDLGAIQQILPAVDRLGDNPGRWRRFWTGYYVDSENGPSGPVTVIATLPVRRQLLIVTADRQFAISPERPVLFVEEYGRLRQALDYARTGQATTFGSGESVERLAKAGWTMQYPVVKPNVPMQSASASSAQPGAPSTARRSRVRARRSLSSASRPNILNDRVAQFLLGITVVMNLAIIIFVLARYSSLPASIALHWNVNGDPDRIGSPREIWVIPIITAIVAIANLILAWSIDTFDRFAARFLLATSSLVGIVAWIALITLMR